MRKPKSKIGVCSYHLCRKRTKVFLCKYCDKYFCEQHIEPKPVLNLKQVSSEKEPLRSKLEEIWRSNKGHPDYAFTPIFWKKLEKEEKEKLERAWEVLDKLKRESYHLEPHHEPAIVYEEGSTKRKVSVFEKIENYWYWNKRKIIKTILAIVLFSIVGYFLYNGFQSGQIQSFLSNMTNEISKWQNESGKSINPVNIISPKPEINTSELELQIHNLVNEERQKHGLKTLNWDSKLADIARKHSQDMAQNNFFSHVNIKGQDPTERGRLVGYYCRKDFGSYYTEGIAENIFQNNLYDSVTYYNGIPSYDWKTQEEIAKSTVSGWMDSPGHRQNILTAIYDKEGIGIAISSDDEVLITQDFC